MRLKNVIISFYCFCYFSPGTPMRYHRYFGFRREEVFNIFNNNNEKDDSLTEDCLNKT